MKTITINLKSLREIEKKEVEDLMKMIFPTEKISIIEYEADSYELTVSFLRNGKKESVLIYNEIAPIGYHNEDLLDDETMRYVQSKLVKLGYSALNWELDSYLY